VVLERCALGAEIGAGEMLVSRANPTLSSLSSEWVEKAEGVKGFRHVSWDDHQHVSIETLDALIARYGMPQFCKIDVEGYECDVLRGLAHPIPALSFEFLAAQRELTANCLEHVACLGDYAFNMSYGEDSVLVLPEWRSASEILSHLEKMPAHVSSGDIYARVAQSA
jgi:hypothetical protein